MREPHTTHTHTHTERCKKTHSLFKQQLEQLAESVTLRLRTISLFCRCPQCSICWHPRVACTTAQPQLALATIPTPTKTFLTHSLSLFVPGRQSAAVFAHSLYQHSWALSITLVHLLFCLYHWPPFPLFACLLSAMPSRLAGIWSVAS